MEEKQTMVKSALFTVRKTKRQKDKETKRQKDKKTKRQKDKKTKRQKDKKTETIMMRMVKMEILGTLVTMTTTAMMSSGEACEKPKMILVSHHTTTTANCSCRPPCKNAPLHASAANTNTDVDTITISRRCEDMINLRKPGSN